MALMEDVGTRDNWRCWICDEPVDRDRSVNDDRGPSVDSYFTAAKASKGKGSKGAAPRERLAHRVCNTRKGAVTPVIGWPSRLLVADPAVLLTTVTRLSLKGGREVVGRCGGADDAEAAADWLADRLTRLAPDVPFQVGAEAGGGQHLIVITAGRRS